MLVGILAPAVHEFLNAVCNIDGTGKFLLHAETGLFRRLSGPFVDQNLFGDAVRFRFVLNEIDFQLFLEEVGHRFLDKLVGDGLLRLVFIGCLRGEAVRNQHKTVRDILERDLGFVLLIFADLLQIGIDGIYEPVSCGFFRASAVLQPGGVVIVFRHIDLIGETECGGDLHLIVITVLTVAAFPLALDESGSGERLLPRDLLDVIQDPFLIEEILGLKLPVDLVAETERHSLVDHRLTAHDIFKILGRNIDIRKYIQIRSPADGRAGLFAIGRFHRQFLAFFSADLSLLEVQFILVPVTPNRNVHILRSVLRGTGTEAVESERILVVLSLIVTVFASGIQFTEHQFPVEPFLILVPVHGTSASEVFTFDGKILIACQRDQIAVTLPRLINGVGEDLEHGMLTSVQSVRTENDARSLSNAICAFQLGNAVIIIFRRFCCHISKTSLTQYIVYNLHNTLVYIVYRRNTKNSSFRIFRIKFMTK